MASADAFSASRSRCVVGDGSPLAGAAGDGVVNAGGTSVTVMAFVALAAGCDGGCDAAVAGLVTGAEAASVAGGDFCCVSLGCGGISNGICNNCKYVVGRSRHSLNCVCDCHAHHSATWTDNIRKMTKSRLESGSVSACCIVKPPKWFVTVTGRTW